MLDPRPQITTPTPGVEVMTFGTSPRYPHVEPGTFDLPRIVYGACEVPLSAACANDLESLERELIDHELHCHRELARMLGLVREALDAREAVERGVTL